MTDTLTGTEISQLDPAVTLDGSEVIPADQGGRTVRVTAQAIANLAGSGTVVVGTGAVDSVNGQTGTVRLTAIDVNLGSVDNTSDQTKNSAFANLTNKTIDGTQNTLQNIPQAAVSGLAVALSTVVNTAGTGLGISGNTISLADTAVSPAQYGSVSTVNQITVDQQGRITGVNSLAIQIGEAAVTNLSTDLGLKAPLASPTFTGTTTAPHYVASGLTGAVAATRYVGGVASAAPTTGTFAVGDYVIGQNGKVYICTAAGTPGTWVDAGSGSSGPPTGSAGGDLAGSGSTYPNPVIANGAVTLAKQANLAGLSIQGNSSGSAAAPQALNATQVKTLLAITEADVASLAADLAALAPTASPTFTGTVTSPLVVGGTSAATSLVLKPNTNATPTGTIDMTGNATAMFRFRASDGHTHIGSDVGGASGLATAIPNVRLMVTARDSTVAFHSFPISVGTGIGVFTSTAEPWRVANGPNANATGLFSSLEIESGTGGTAAEHIATFSVSRNFDPNYNGCSVGGQFYGYANVNTFSGLHTDGCLPFGADIKARVDSTVTDASHPALSSIETGGTDDSWHRQTNVGLAVRIVNQGKNHIRNALVISNTPSRPGAFENGLVIATGPLSSLYGAGWSSTTAYLGGELLNVSGTKYVCTAAVTGGTGPGVDTAHWFAVGAISVPPTWVTGRDHDVHTLVTDAGATWACAVFHTNGTTAPHLDQWNGFNGVAGPDGLASATASAGHWVPWTNSIGITDRYVNTGLTSHTTSPGYSIWIGPIGGSGMTGNAPSGTGQDFSVDTSANLTVAGNIGFNGKATQALTGWAAPTATLARTAVANPSYTTTGATGATAGAFDTAAHRDAIITAVFNNTKAIAALLSDLIANGVIG